MENRFQFSLRSLLGATLWLSLCLGAFTALSNLRPKSFHGWNDWLAAGIIVFLGGLVMVSPFLAIAELLRRQRSAVSAFLLITLLLWCLIWGCFLEFLAI